MKENDKLADVSYISKMFTSQFKLVNTVPSYELSVGLLIKKYKTFTWLIY